VLAEFCLAFMVRVTDLVPLAEGGIVSSWSATEGDESKVEFKRTKVSEVMSSKARKVNGYTSRA